MIRAIFVRNFQSLREVSLTLGKLTVVVGSTDVGKSALIRAVRAAAENWRGDSFIYEGAKDCQISVDVGTCAVTWFKPTKKSAIYYTSATGGALAQVPIDTAGDLLNLREVELSKAVRLQINFQSQLDPPFLLRESNIVKSKILGEITNAGLILFSLSTLKRLSAANSGSLSIRRQDVSTDKKQLEAYVQLQVIQADFNKACLLVSEVQVLVSSCNSMVELANSLVHVMQVMRTFEDRYTNIMAVWEQLAVIGFDSLKMRKQVQSLSELSKAEVDIVREISLAKSAAKKISILEGSLPDITEIEHYLQQLSLLQGYVDAVNGAGVTVSVLEKEVQTAISHLQSAELAVNKVKASLQICPLCDAPLLAEVHDHASSSI